MIKANKYKKNIEERNFVIDNLSFIKQRKRSRLSKGESKIADFLTSNMVEFYREFYFKDFKVLRSRKLLFFDFFCPQYKLCIEYDGQQHYTGVFNGKKLTNQRRNDFLKNAFCKVMGLNLLRIKYTDIENIEDIICKKFDSIDPII